MEFICDYLRMMVGGNLNAFEIENLMDVEIETHHQEAHVPVHAVTKMADADAGLRHRRGGDGRGQRHGFGRRAPGGAGQDDRRRLVGTFLGILVSYGFVAPIAGQLEQKVEEEEGKIYPGDQDRPARQHERLRAPGGVEFGRKVLLLGRSPAVHRTRGRPEGAQGQVSPALPAISRAES
jgi:chemotaxis protein MotA